MAETEAPKITALAPWFGGNRLLGSRVGEALSGCRWVGVPFMGGGAELAHIEARTIVANDLHKMVINLARVLAHDKLGALLIRELRRMPFHALALAHAQEAAACWERDLAGDDGRLPMFPHYNAARDYFVACWMGRSAQAGTGDELSGSLPVRWDAAGGDSAVRFRSAAVSLRAWRRVVARCNFTCLDAFEFLAKCKDRPDHGVYADAPWPDDGDGYRHKFGEAAQRRLAATLAGYERARVVVRFGDHPLIRELYPEPEWRWVEFAGRTSANKAKREVLLLRNAPADLLAG